MIEVSAISKSLSSCVPGRSDKYFWYNANVPIIQDRIKNITKNNAIFLILCVNITDFFFFLAANEPRFFCGDLLLAFTVLFVTGFLFFVFEAVTIFFLSKLTDFFL